MNRIQWHFFLLVLTLLSLSSLEALAQRPPIASSPEQLYDAGFELKNKKLYGLAADYFGQYLVFGQDPLRKQEAQYEQAFMALSLDRTVGPVLMERFAVEYSGSYPSSKAWYELGNYYFRHKNYDQASIVFAKTNAALLPGPMQLELDFKSGYALFAIGKPDLAAKFFNRIKSAEHIYTAPANYYAANIEIGQDRYNEALIDLDRAAKDDIYKPFVPLLRIQALSRKKEYAKVIVQGSQALVDSSGTKGTKEIGILVGDAHFALQEYQKAGKYYDNFAGEPSLVDRFLSYRIGFSRYKNGKYAQSLPIFEQLATRLDAADTVLHLSSYYLGAVFTQLNQKANAKAAFSQARVLPYSPKTAQAAWFQEGKIAMDLERYQEAIDILKSFIDKYSNSHYINQANELLAEAYLRGNDFEQALNYLSNLGSDKSKSSKVIFQRASYLKAISLYNDNKINESLVFFKQSLVDAPDPDLQVAAWYWSGEAHSANGNYEQAKQPYQSVLQTPAGQNNEIYTDAEYGLAYAFFNTSEYEKALPLFRKYTNKMADAAANKKFYNEALLRLADCYYADKNYKSALENYQKSIDNNHPDADYASYQKGQILSANGNYEQAQVSLKQAIKQYPESKYIAEMQFLLANIELDQGRYQSAIDGFGQVIEKNPGVHLLPYCYLKRATAYNNLNQKEAAAQDYKSLLDQFPTHKNAGSALIGLQQIWTNQGKTEALDEYIKKYKKTNPDDESIESLEFETAKGLYFNQKYQKSIEALESFVLSYPANAMLSEASFYIGEAYYRTGQSDASILAHKKVFGSGKNSFSIRSLGRLAELELAKNNLDQAIIYFRLLDGQARNKKEQYVAWAGLMDGFFKQLKYDSAARYASKIGQSPQAPSDFVNRASLYLGKIAMAKSDYDKAADEFLNTANNARDQYGAEAQYRIGEILNKQKKYKESLDALYALSTNFSSYKKWYDLSFLLIADNFIGLNNYFQARATLNTIIEKAESNEIKTIARAKLQVIKNK